MSALQDFRFALRGMLRHIGFSLTVVTVMALGVGATTFAFVAIKGFLLEPLPYPDSDSLVHIELTSAENPNGMAIGLHDFRDLSDQQTSFRSLFAYYVGTVNLSGDDLPERFDGVFVTANALDQIGVAPALGRGFLPDEDRPGAPRSVVIGWRIWQERFGADPAAVGARVRMNGQPATIVGVMPEGFEWPRRNQLWVPMQHDTDRLVRGDTVTVVAFGRLSAGVAIEQARAEMATLYQGILDAHTDWNVGATPSLRPYRQEFVSAQTMAVLTAMQLATALVLLIACANVANLILVRTVSRTRELSVRAALGASRWRLVAGTLLESVTLSLVGGAIGLAIAHAGGVAAERYLLAHGADFPYWMSFAADWRVALFALIVATLAGVFAGLVPALRAARRDVFLGLKSGGGGGTGLGVGRFTRGLIAVEIAMSCALLIGGALSVRSVFHLRDAPLGAEVSGVMSGRIGLFEAQYPDVDSRRRFWEALEARIAGIPGVTQASTTTSLPTYASGWSRYQVEGVASPPDARRPFVRSVVVTPAFFDSFRIPLRAGRLFGATDVAESMPVVVVNRAFAARTWPGSDAVGRRLLLGDADSNEPAATVVGVVGDVYHHGLQSGPAQPAIYQPLAQADARFATIAARTEGQPALLAQPIREALRGIDPDLPIYWLQPAQVWVDQSRADTNLLGFMFGAFGMVALLLASVGVYGVLAFAVAQRSREFGVRRALGAESRNITRLVLRQGVRQLLIALPVGLALAFALGHLLQSVLTGVSSHDPASFLGVPAILAIVVLLACLVPAHRAARVDPMNALREE